MELNIAKRITPKYITDLEENEIFVFGSNLPGLHVGGAANIAHNKWGAVWGQGEGIQGQTYAIPTMQGDIETVEPYVNEFIEFAKKHQDLKFLVTPVGCGIAGFTPKEIAPLFREAADLPNVFLPRSFWDVMR